MILYRVLTWCGFITAFSWIFSMIVSLGFGSWPTHTGIIGGNIIGAAWAFAAACLAFHARISKGPAVHGGGGRAPEGISARGESGEM